jgi:hypothetical protein
MDSATALDWCRAVVATSILASVITPAKEVCDLDHALSQVPVMMAR